MNVTKERQMRIWIQKQKRLVNEAVTEMDRGRLIGMWIGYLNGLRLTNVLTYSEYNQYFDELKNFVEGAEVA